ncbi:MAG: ECF-type sigma factor [Gemmatimonadaceae bacterium]
MSSEPTHPTRETARERSDDQFIRLYQELRLIADRLLRKEAAGHTLQPTALLNEAWLKLTGSPQLERLERTHYLAIAARAMRQVLVEHARQRRAAKRGGALTPITLTDDQLGVSLPIDDMIDLDEALRQLGEQDERLLRVVELRFFVGLDEQETAEALGVTTRTVQRDWVKARAWLLSELRDDTGTGA